MNIPSIITVLSAAALVLASFLLYESLKGGGLPGCGVGSACDAVTSSRWSRWAGVPVAGPGILVYLLMLAGSLLVRPSMTVEAQKVGWIILVGSATIVAGASLWFLGLQVLVIRRMCPYCTGLHALGLAIAGVVAYHGTAAGGSMDAIAPAWPIGFSGAALVMLVAGQVFIAPKSYKVQQLSEKATIAADLPLMPAIGSAADEAGAATAAIPPSVEPRRIRKFVLAKGRVTVDAYEWPIIGSPEAKYIIVDLFDYTCEDCRHVQRVLEQAVQRYGDQLAVVKVPVPLERACNPLVEKDEPKHAKACRYARLALALWLARPERFVQYHRWLLGRELPTPLEEARQRAGALVGFDGLESALADPAVEQHLREGVEMLKAAGGGKIPKLLLPQAVVWGRVPTIEALSQVLEQQLRLA
jgi:uncharacterized membrane protein/protein-disulfide isomerase